MISYDRLKEKSGDITEYSHYYAMWCPFDEHKSKALIVFQDGWFRCLSCGENGNHSRLWDKLRGWEAPSTVHCIDSWVPPYLSSNLDDQEAFCLEAHDILLKNLVTLGWYLEKRKVINRVAPCVLGWNGGWYTIPIFKKNKKFDGYVMRASLSVQKATGRRFHMPQNMGSKMYVPDWRLLDTAPFITIVFGMFDALSLSDLGVPVVTDTAGKKGFDPKWLEEYRKPIWIIPDKGEEDDARRLANEFGWRGRILNLEYTDTIKDPAGFVEANRGRDLLMYILARTGDTH